MYFKGRRSPYSADIGTIENDNTIRFNKAYFSDRSGEHGDESIVSRGQSSSDLFSEFAIKVIDSVIREYEHIVIASNKVASNSELRGQYIGVNDIFECDTDSYLFELRYSSGDIVDNISSCRIDDK